MNRIPPSTEVVVQFHEFFWWKNSFSFRSRHEVLVDFRFWGYLMTTQLRCGHCWGYWYWHIGVTRWWFTSLLLYSPDSRTFSVPVLRIVNMNVLCVFFCTPGAYYNACGMRLCDFASVFFCISSTWLKYIKIDHTMGMFLSQTAKAVMDNSTRIHGKLHPMHLASNWKSGGGVSSSLLVSSLRGWWALRQVLPVNKWLQTVIYFFL